MSECRPRRGPWWYYSRTEEGKELRHPLPAAPPVARRGCRRPASPGQEEQILLDEGALAEGSEYFAVGTCGL